MPGEIKGKVLVIAGSDPSGGAGLEADQKVLAAHSIYALTATTALTAQNTAGVFNVHVTPPSFLREQIDAVLADIRPDIVKIGMLAGRKTIRTVAAALEEHGLLEKTVLDPVMVATTGARLLDDDAVGDMRKLCERVRVATPNWEEGQLLLEDLAEEVLNVDGMEKVARRLFDRLGCAWVLLKGGHCPVDREGNIVRSGGEREMMTVVDVLVGCESREGERDGKVTMRRMENRYLGGVNTHGTGCSLSAALAANLTMGGGTMTMPEAVERAVKYVREGIRTAPGLGSGNGPLNHFHSMMVLPFTAGSFVTYLLSRPDVKPVWHRFVHHPFPLAVGNGTLPLESFKGYLVQDYLYLVYFARANALAAYKAKNMADVAAGAAIVTHIETEMRLHLDYCAGFGLTRREMEETEERMECTAYARYILDVGQSEDWLALQVALAPCLLGYGTVAEMLMASPDTKKEGNPYFKWICNYVAEDYVEAVRKGSELLERHAQLQSPARIEELVSIFIHATKMEIGFWDMFPSEPSK